MAWSSSPSALASATPFPAVSDAAIDSVLNEAANAFRYGQIEEAVARIRSLVADLVGSPERCDLAGLILLGAQLPAEALVWFERARALQPNYWQAASHAGSVLLTLGRLDEALSALDMAVGQGFVDSATYYHRGVVLRALGRRDEAIASLDQALRVEPDYPDALRIGALILAEAGRDEQALQFFEAALRSKPDFFEVLLERANLLRQLERCDEAVAAFSRGLQLLPGNVALLNNRGVVFIDLGDFDAALADFDAALAIDPDLPEAVFNRGTVLLQESDPEIALAAFDRAIALRPVYPDAWVGRGVAFRKMGQMEPALAAFDVAIDQKPDSAHARNNKGGVQLLLGDFENGLEGYEYRWMTGLTHKFKLEFPIPEWSGTIRPGEKLIVFDEQGIGDTIQFSRYLPLLAEAGVEITFFCRSKALRLLRSLPQAIRCVDYFGPEEHFDSQIALSSLVHASGTRVSTIPANVPYLTAEPALVAVWAERLAQSGNMQDLKIGICWAGNPNVRADPRRSVPLKAFLPLCGLEGVRVISLQKHHGLDEIAALPVGTKLETLGDAFDGGEDAFIDTAAVMQNLDLIISCDTSTAHLAGALGRPVFTLLKQIPDWRWMLDRADSPWYPTMQLFRQTRRGDWDEVVARVVAAVGQMQKDRRSALSA
ncbi:tetratricopeptide repeat protein [Methylovirgula sp. HY1]|uniref:tetratricopeptide repeat-containing glycosyltransferase family protein n=1 Tax=Methylovirgula sp. HY1 TaxID=2822761 RepID=UPI001C5BECAA|nr:tetratricopeptide repeat protein [Methylovirgula sp. HY1]QXX75697.1 Lipoprotein NlpI [Methylovirgula sp. HY1]